ncbi:protein kinase domain-containing protein [Paludisphaera rhizosphaerae]|uniref:protein kinase domain-containing protein n=1 Tax=Paludisphaera rhizosphaerae TaxID=2711216 RepID=UPI0013E9E9E6|nr:protein kinase [Paludisphaera rhizosphaerae]
MSTGDSSRDRDPLDRMAEEFVARHRRGERPALTEYVDRHPDLAEQIRDLFPALVMMEQLKPGHLDSTGGFGEGGSAQDSPKLDRLGEFRILGEVGRGGMGVVYEAIQESLGRYVALKVLPMHVRIDEVQMERFQLEARSAARLHHTHIVPVYGIGQCDGVHYYAMQFIHGCGLDAVINDLRRLLPAAPAAKPVSADAPTVGDTDRSRAAARSLLTGRNVDGDVSADFRVDAARDGRSTSTRGKDGSALSGQTEPGYHRRVARIGMQVAEALAHAHGQGILHRDIKPSNLLLDAEGEIWVTDFGLAKVEGSDGLTRTGDIVGTLRYMAPERFEGWSDPRSDVYGLGMTLYELLTLRPAHQAATRARLIEKVLHEPAPPPRKADPTIPRDLETIVLKAIAKEPAERYPTAQSLADDLENFLIGKPIQARRVGSLERVWRWCKRNPAAAGMIGVSGIALLTLVGLGVALAYQSRLQAAYAAKDEAFARERTFLYENRVLFADRELNDNTPHRAEQMLDECPPERRDWEWNYLKRQCHAELMIIQAHQTRIEALAISPDGRWIASGANPDKRLRVWNAETGREHWTLPAHLHDIFSVAFSPDSSRIASTGGKLTLIDRVQVHEVATGRNVLSIPLETGGASSVAFSPDGLRIAVASGAISQPRWVKICDAQKGDVLLSISTGSQGVMSPCFSPDGTSLAAVVGSIDESSASWPNNEARIWDSKTGELRFAIRGHTKPLMIVKFSPDGRLIATAGYDSTVRIHDASDGRERLVFRGHRGCVNVVAFSPESGRIASTSDDGSAKVWNPATGDEEITLRGHRGGFFGVVFSPDGRRLFTSGYDGTVRVWDATRSPEARTISASRDIVASLAFSPDGRRLVTAGGDRTLRHWDVPSGRLLAVWEGHREPVNAVAFSPDGTRVASAAGDWQKTNQLGELNIWDAATGEIVHSLRAHQALVWSVAFSPDGRRLVSGGGEKFTPGQEVIVWDVASGERVRSFSDLPNGVLSAVYSPDGRKIAACTGPMVKIWDAGTGGNPVTFEGHADDALAVAFSPDGRRLFELSDSPIVRIWDLSTGRQLEPLVSDKFMTRALVFSPDGRRFASGGTEQAVKVWDASTGQQLIALRGHRDEIRAVAFSPDGRLIASGDNNGIVKIWDGSSWDESSMERAGR